MNQEWKLEEATNVEIGANSPIAFLRDNVVYRREKGQNDIVAATESSDHSSPDLPKIAKFCRSRRNDDVINTSEVYFMLSTKGEAFLFHKSRVLMKDELKKYGTIFAIRCSKGAYWFQNKQGWFCFTFNGEPRFNVCG